MGDRKQVLLAVPDELLRMHLSNYLNSKSLNVLEAPTYENAFEIILSQQLQGIIIADNWMVTGDGKLTAIKKSLLSDIPVLMLIVHRETYQWLNIACEPPLQDYRNIPISSDEIDWFLQHAGLVA